MFDYLVMACKDVDYTAVIAILNCPHRTILVLKLTLVLEIHFKVCCQYSSYKGPTKILTTGVIPVVH